MSEYLNIAVDALDEQSRAIGALSKRIGANFSQAIEAILACKGRVVVCGIGKSGLVGQKMVATFASTGTPSFFLHPTEAFHGDLGMLKPSDIVILISNSGETEEVVRLLPSLKAFGNGTIAMTGRGDSVLAKNVDIWLDVSVEREVCPNNLAPTTSTLVTMAMGDALAVALVKARDFKPTDFARYHPGGSLGRKLLTRVQDVMHRTLPIVDPDMAFHDCLLKMTAGRLGLALVMTGDELLGIVTDGDLRRALLRQTNPAGLVASALMTPRPHTINPDALLVDAEKYMHEHKIKALVVLDGKSPCGVLEIFD